MVSLNPDYFHFEKNASIYATEDRFNEFWTEKNDHEGRLMQTECRANLTKMKYKPIRLTFPHIDKQTALRKLLWHEDDLISNVCFTPNANVNIFCVLLNICFYNGSDNIIKLNFLSDNPTSLCCMGPINWRERCVGCSVLYNSNGRSRFHNL